MDIKETKRIDMGNHYIIYGEFVPDDNDVDWMHEGNRAALNQILEDEYGAANILINPNSYIVDWSFSIMIKKKSS